MIVFHPKKCSVPPTRGLHSETNLPNRIPGIVVETTLPFLK